jgi:endonuclease YncB( thermonuclease family)
VRRLVVILVPLAFALTVAQADARVGSCLGDGSAPVCHFWTGKVTFVDDGDTIQVDLAGDETRRAYRVRFIGVQAMEQSVYSMDPRRRRGACHALEATARVEQLIRASHWKVRLAAQDPATRFRERLGRSIAVRIHGRWEDLGEKLIGEGLALWMPDIRETAWNFRYNELEQEAEREHAGLWDPTYCGKGPSEGAPLRMWANSDPPGDDYTNVDGEWIKIENLSPTTPVALGGWWVRDSMLRRFTFPRGTVLEPRDTVTVYVGRGSDTPTSFYWGLDIPIFQNAGDDGRDLGDGAYLFDPQGDLRRAMVYPCLVDCVDPNADAVEITAQPRRQERVLLHNVSDHPVDLYGYRLTKPGYAYDFGPNSVLDPDETMEIDTGGDPTEDTPVERHWGIDHPMLVDRGDAVRLTTFTGITIACDAWGDASC